MIDKLIALANASKIDIQITSYDHRDTTIQVKDDQLETFNISKRKHYLIVAKIGKKTVKLATENLENPEEILHLLQEQAHLLDNTTTIPFAKEEILPIKEEEQTVDTEKVIHELTSLNELKKDFQELLSIEGEYTHHYEKIAIDNSHVHLMDTNQYGVYGLSVTVQEEEHMESCYTAVSDIDVDLKQLALEQIHKALDRLHFQSLATNRYNVILSNECVADLLTQFAPIFEAQLIQKRKSVLTGKLHEKIFSQAFHLVEDPLYNHGFGKRIFDDEGSKTFKKEIIKDKAFVQMLYDNESATNDQVQSTGNSYGVYGMYLEPGSSTLEELIQDLKDGIYIDHLTGLHAGTNLNDGNISLQAEGYYIKDGKKDHALKMIILSTNFIELFSHIKEVANDLRFDHAKCGAPSVSFTDIAIAGEE